MTDAELRLSGPQIDEVATGRPGAATLALLRTGQESLRRLLLLAVRRRAGPASAEAFELLGRAATAAREPVERIVTRPFAHAWATSVLDADPAAAVRDLAALAAAAAVRAGLDVDTTVEVTGAELFLPGVGLLDRLHCPTVAVRRRGGDLTFGCPHPAASAPRRQPARTITITDGWTIDVEDQEPRRTALGPPRTLSSEALRDATVLLRQAWSMVERQHAGYAPVTRALWRSVAPLAGDGSHAISSSSPQAGGCVAMSLGLSPATAAQLLIHEVQHSLLAAATDLVPFCAGPARERYRAPWKPVPRSAPALLQGVFAHASVIDYWAARRHAVPTDREASWQFAYLREVTTAAIEALRSSTELTAAGRRLVDGLRARATRWGGDTVPEAVAGPARRTARAEAVRWRLTNLRGAQAAAGRLAEAYANGQECPALPAPDLGAGDGADGGADGGAGRVRAGAVIARLHAAGVGGTPEAAGGPERARARRAVQERPADDEAWIALAAVDPTPLLAGRPDLLRAVLLALHARGDAEIPTPDELAGWLAAGWHEDHASVW